MSLDDRTEANGFVLATDEGRRFWFLNTLAITKVSSEDSRGRLCIVVGLA